MARLTEQTFLPQNTQTVAEHACRAYGLDPAGAVLLRHQTNAVFKLVTAPVIVKVTRPGITHTDVVVSLVEWLHEHNVPTVSLIQGSPQPLTVAGCAVTFWEYLPQSTPILAQEIAEPLRVLHECPPPPQALPALDPIGAIHRSIDTSRILDDDERRLLRRTCGDLETLYRQLPYQDTSRVLHGDPQHRNTLRGPDSVVLCDLDSMVIGPPEWDLVTIEVHCRRFSHPPDHYRAFADRYGADIRTWHGYPVLSAVRELRMITSNARKSAAGSAQADEVHRRVRDLHLAPTTPWTIL
ncbi:phosphotransferase [Actinokineospora enzanensis]|uniref:phosphotransferase n=1 Tax=Actinokineospora enzanensis TaxID=155975 RepID=UPI0007C4B45D|nr:phosphotransferase [Actinokineospora enzanensis]